MKRHQGPAKDHGKESLTQPEGPLVAPTASSGAAQNASNDLSQAEKNRPSLPQRFSPLATPSATRKVLEEWGLNTKHRLGQNFLINDGVIGRILQLAQLDESDVVLEVGPGIGTLTRALASQAGAVVAIEADRELEPVLRGTLGQGETPFALLMGDALKVTPDAISAAIGGLSVEGLAHAPNKFVANLPYQVAATLILQFFQELPSINRAVCMVQKEVADRIAASPGSKTYGAYTAKLGLFAQVTGRFEVGPQNFLPPPRVDSAVVRLDRLMRTNDQGEPLDATFIAGCVRTIDAAFAQRRKTIRNSMGSLGFDKSLLDQAFEAAGISSSARAETLTTQEFVTLTSKLFDLGAL